MLTRRSTLKHLTLAGLTAVAGCTTLGEGQAKVVVVGGGFAGATLARTIKRAAPSIHVTLVEPKTTYTACPLSNLVVSSNRSLQAQQFGYRNIAADGVEVVHEMAVGIDAGHTHSHPSIWRACALRSPCALTWHRDELRRDTGIRRSS